VSLYETFQASLPLKQPSLQKHPDIQLTSASCYSKFSMHNTHTHRILVILLFYPAAQIRVSKSCSGNTETSNESAKFNDTKSAEKKQKQKNPRSKECT